MKYLLTVVIAALSWGLAAQDAPQQLPTAPSATKFPPQKTTSPPASETGQASPPAPAAPPAAADPSPPTQANTSASSAPQTNITPQPAPSTEPPKSNALPPSTSAKPAGTTESGDNPDELTIIRKRVDEVNVVFTVTDKRGHFVKDLTKNDFRVYDDNKPAESVRARSGARPTCRCASACSSTPAIRCATALSSSRKQLSSS